MALDDEFNIELAIGPPTSEVVQCARHCLKVLLAMPNPDLENIFTAIALLLTDVLGNMDFPTQEARDMVPDLFAEVLKRNLRLVDANDRAIGSRA